MRILSARHLQCFAAPTDILSLILKRAETEIDYTDAVTLAISTSLVVNFPRPRFAVLPISLGITLVGLSGTVS